MVLILAKFITGNIIASSLLREVIVEINDLQYGYNIAGAVILKKFSINSSSVFLPNSK